ncbi:prolyl 4-hydroxylase subunit alpha [Paenibacillus sp. HJL G12]|uniref:Prolyl 4-hydroxylase subunit alpha n=1 Tax=Paenibacillus dendrobii TaxID=2691084 RepID=A0A7X3IFJ7_9BACL|nr:2OG-Fe(II) oxygenase [Paenibacillus dendrobii]MWV42969.1 prolyl 4-hydroxylase subunit alpha [Paenibacillus dendrobii]
MDKRLSERIAALDWTSLHRSMDEQGFALFPPILDELECAQLADSYEDEPLYRKTIDMKRYRFGAGEYKYYQAPLPDIPQQLRQGFYPELAQAANRWLNQLGKPPRYPDSLQNFLEECHAAGQTRSTPLILKYEAEGYNCLHQDLYGEIYFPFQVLLVLNQQGADYEGGEFLLVEQRPRAQSRGHVIRLDRGAGVIFPTQMRPVQGTRGHYQAKLRHGVGTITSGTRYSLGIIFHDAT